MKSLDIWLSEYGESHQNPKNILIHKICVPMIFFSIIGMAATVHIWNFTLAEWLFLLVLPFYFLLGRKAMWLFAIEFFFCMFIARFLAPYTPLLYFSFGVFVVGWVGQFVGHKIEGKKPSFIQDLKFLLIGPLWVFLGNQKQPPHEKVT